VIGEHDGTNGRDLLRNTHGNAGVNE